MNSLSLYCEKVCAFIGVYYILSDYPCMNRYIDTNTSRGSSIPV